MGTHKAPDREQGEHSQQDQDGRQQVAQAEQVGVIPGVFCRRGGLGLHGAGQLLGVLLRGQSLEQLRHGLDALHRLEPQAVLQNVREVDRQGRVDGAGFGVGVRHQPLGGGHRAQAADHPIKDGGKAVFIGIAALKLGGGVLLRGRETLVQLLVEAASGRAQAHGGVARQPGPAIVQHPDVGRADAPVHQPHLVHGRHALKHGLQHGTGGGRLHGAGVIFQPFLQGPSTGVLHHGVDGIVLFKHVQHGFQAVGRGDALDGVVEVRKIHPGGLEQHLAAGFGA